MRRSSLALAMPTGLFSIGRHRDPAGGAAATGDWPLPNSCKRCLSFFISLANFPRMPSVFTMWATPRSNPASFSHVIRCRKRSMQSSMSCINSSICSPHSRATAVRGASPQ
uniref:Uncharacterized protein n=1 Tax=Arundo donax TaxID=35708 RepID=A0A0A9BWW7_ARUDO